MIPIFNISRELWKQKPQQWGNFSDVQSALFHNAERMGIDPQSIELAMPMWNPGDQRDYSKNGLIGINSGSVFEQNSLYFYNSSRSVITLSVDASELGIDGALPRTIITTFAAQVANAQGGLWSMGSQAILGDLSLRQETTKWRVQVWGSSSIADVTGYDTVGKDHTFTVHYDGSTISLFDEKMSLLTSGAVTLNTTTAKDLSIGRWDYDNSTAWYWLGKIYGVTVFSEALPTAQITCLSDNPYALWQPRTPTYFSLPDTGTPPSTLLPTMMNENLGKNLFKTGAYF